MADSTPIMIAVAPNGARKSKADHPRLPLSALELAATAQECLAAGASMIHLHVRDAEGRHSLEADRYAAAIAAIRQRVGDDLIVQVTTEAAGRYGPHEQMEVIEALRPEAVSIAIRELFADPAIELIATSYLHALAARGTFVQYIIYDADDLRRCAALHAAGIIPQRSPSVLIVLGSYADQRAGAVRDLVPLLAAMPQGWAWAVCAFGPAELRCVIAAVLHGGDIRVGFENNLQLPWGETANSNAALVQATVAALSPLGFRAATCAEARRHLQQLSS